MGATAKIMAWMGLDATNFAANVDGAKTKLNSMEMSMRSVHKMSRMMFGLGMMAEVISQYKELKEYQEKSGVKIISDDDMQNLDRTADSIKKVKLELVGLVATKISHFIEGWKAAWAGLAATIEGTDVAQAMADALGGEDPEALAAAQKAHEAKVKASKEDLMNVQQKAEAEKENNVALQSRLKAEDAARKGGKPMLNQAEYLKLQDDIMDSDKKLFEYRKTAEKEDEALSKQKLALALAESELAAKQIADSDKIAQAKLKEAEAVLKVDEATKQLARTVNDTVTGESDEARQTRIAKAKTDLRNAQSGQVEAARSVADVQKGIDRERMEAEQGLAEARARLRAADMENGTQLGKLKASKELADEKLHIARNSPHLAGETEADRIKRRTKIVNAEADAKEAEKAVEKYYLDLEKKKERIRKDAADKEKDIKGGRDISPTALSVGGGLQSIGGYFASKGAVAASVASRSEILMDKVEKNTAEAAKALARLADPDSE